ncbi:MAG: UDP-2,3-diacylglucosamine diphosphatase [Bacteroidetes bacterium QH_7_62_13]|nr:MAG: UDP-2,3-diacylglucosamine diphosphatase [Bacteroidetes bacterium QH_7_62_13]
MEPPTHYRTVWISDPHLGTPQAKAEFLLHFLRQHEADRYYLVGDIFDGWALQRSWYWPSSHNDVVQALLRKAKSTTVTYIPGNHDEVARDFPGLQLGGITIQERAVHTTADDRRFVVVHGDEFEGVVRHSEWLEFLGGWAYVGVLKMDRWFNQVRRLLDLPYWSLSSYLKHSTQRARQFIDDFERTAADQAAEQGFDGIICGHVHHPRLRTIDGTHYVNTGDWVESCTALVEHIDGRLELLRWLPDGQGTREAIATEAPFSRDGQHVPAEALDPDVQAP